MPPRKKAAAAAAADANGDAADPPKATRSSTRTKKAALPAAAPVAAAPAKPKAKRGRAAAASDNEDEAEKPAAKKKKTTKKAAKKDEPVDDDAEDVTKQDDAMDEEKDDPASDKEEPKKMVTVLKRGAAPVDPTSGKVDSHLVYSNEEGVWDAMLNQTDIGANANKFYVLQLLHPNSSNSQCVLFTRWGRVGENGQNQTKGPFPASQAIIEFKKQFKAKAGVAWEARVGMTAKKGKYFWIERDYNDEEEDDKQEEGSKKKKEEDPIPDSKLDSEIQDLCNLIFNTSLIDAHLSSMNYDAKKLPLGKLSKNTILNGFAALKDLADAIQNPDSELVKTHGNKRAACEELSGRYYSIIPHDFGRQRPITIDNDVALKRELDLVDALGDMEIASKLISSTAHTDSDGKPVNPIDANFLSLGLTKMEAVQSKSTEFEVLEKYVRDTHGRTHNIRVNMRHAYRVERDSETEAFTKGGFHEVDDGERMLLWHGSRTTNFAGILKQGLRIAPPEAPVTGYMFGKGVYFADMMSKVSPISQTHRDLEIEQFASTVGQLLLLTQYDADVHCKQNKKRATKGIGRTQPKKWKDAGEALGNDSLKGCHMPDSPGEDVNTPGVYLQYNEYIVYDAAQIRLRYLLMVDM
ncbi:hypothetical protein HGRIS_008098 [Hohenbuehelia grisea]|uniref:Poly [ADP-ribose] polymerase n=1 Tax=Hohenbuehelia grisea TaxID=104357 RepID=A0ABR3J753_9AGAR